MSLPLIIAAAAGVYIVTSGKKRSRPKSRIIDKGSYSYSSDCNHLWIAGFDVAQIDTVKPNDQQAAAIRQFGEEVTSPAAAAALAAKYGGVAAGDRPPMWVTELGLDTIANILPGCAFEEGKTPGRAALALLPMAMIWVGIILPGDGDEFTEAAAAEYRILAEATAESGGVASNVVKLIRLVRENPEKYGA